MKLYDLTETLKKLSPHPDGYTLANLASLCRDGQITPLFPYSLYISKAIDIDDEGAPIYTPGDVAKFDGYLTHDNLISLLDGYNDAIELEEATVCEFNEGHLTKGDTARLLARPFQYIKYASGEDDYDSADPFTIERDRLVFAASEVERYYITSYCFDDVSTPGALLEEAQATIKEQRQRIEQLEAQLLRPQADTPASARVLDAIFNESNEYYAPDLVHAIKLWTNLYINGSIDGDSHSSKANSWIAGNTDYGKDSHNTSVKRLRETTTPLKDFGKARKKG